MRFTTDGALASPTWRANNDESAITSTVRQNVTDDYLLTVQRTHQFLLGYLDWDNTVEGREFWSRAADQVTILYTILRNLRDEEILERRRAATSPPENVEAPTPTRNNRRTGRANPAATAPIMPSTAFNWDDFPPITADMLHPLTFTRRP